MTAIRKFSFDTVFSADGKVLRDGAATREIYSADEVAAEKTKAYEQGKSESEAAAQLALTKELKRFGDDVRRLLGQYQSDFAKARQELAELALVMTKAVAGAALDAHGDDKILSAFNEIVDTLPEAPRLVVKLPADAADRLRPLLEQAAQAQGFEGALAFKTDAAAGPGDVAFEWRDGAIRLSSAETIQRIQEIIHARLSSAQGVEQ